MLERMSEFFENRLDGYDEHMLTNIESAWEFYPFTAECLPKADGCRVIDLGCGTGLELEYYFALNPTARVTGIDLSQGMLDALSAKLKGKDITLICGSYFDVHLGENVFDAAVSVESLHHFTKAEKIPLYEKLCKAIKDGGYFVLTDYFALSDEEEQMHRDTFVALKKEQGLTDGEFYHYDTPLTVAHEIEALTAAGFISVEVLKKWGATYTIRATKQNVLNITNGDCFNEYFLSKFGGEAVPFCEAMMDGETVSDIYSGEFIKLRSKELGISDEEYKSKMHVQVALAENKYNELCLWFGKDTFCQTNLLTLLAYFEQIGYGGQVVLNYIEDESFEVIKDNITVTLGSYKKLYEDILIAKKHPADFGGLDADALDLYFDYYSDSGALARLVRENSDKDDMALVCLLLENSKAYGLSDLQAENLIKKYSIQ